jgi:hypothetical protein
VGDAVTFSEMTVVKSGSQLLTRRRHFSIKTGLKKWKKACGKRRRDEREREINGTK